MGDDRAFMLSALKRRKIIGRCEYPIVESQLLSGLTALTYEIDHGPAKCGDADGEVVVLDGLAGSGELGFGW